MRAVEWGESLKKWLSLIYFTMIMMVDFGQVLPGLAYAYYRLCLFLGSIRLDIDTA